MVWHVGKVRMIVDVLDTRRERNNRETIRSKGQVGPAIVQIPGLSPVMSDGRRGRRIANPPYQIAIYYPWTLYNYFL